SGFKGSPGDIVNALMEYVGREGNLMMVSIPFRGSAFDHLMKNKPFYIQKTVSMMGLVTETFRRKEGVLRSFHPTHPVLVYGKDAAWLADGHDRCLYPCGPDSPFDKFRRLKGKILFFDVGFGAITFFHYVEDLIKDKLPFDVYHPEPFSAPAYDEKNQLHQIKTYAFNKNVVRRADKLEEEMLRWNLIKKGKIGRSNLILVEAEDVVGRQTSMVEAGNLPYDLPKNPIPTSAESL
ncbi:MAG TPA: AAC(3) family N-acetyltransferase, partial [Candidatus Manganitrophaceae bacterium]